MLIIKRFIDKFNHFDGNTKIVMINTISSGGIKVLTIVIMIFSTPVYIRYFNNNEVLGIWFTVLSVLAWILNFDMGIGNGLRNRLVEAFSEKDNIKIKKYISSAYAFLTTVSVFIVTALVLLSNFVNWNRIFNISEDVLKSSVLNKTVIILIISIGFQFVLRLISSVLYALQKSFIPSLINLVTNVLMLVVIIICNYIGNNNNIIVLAYTYLFAVNLPLIVGTICVFATELKGAVPQLKYYERNYAIDTLKIGGIFLWLQFISLILNNTNSYLITIFRGNVEVVEYNIYYKIFSLVGTVVLLLTTPIWSAVTKAKAEKNFVWMRKLYNKMCLIGFLSIIFEFIIIIPLQLIFDVWLGDKTIIVNIGFAFIFAMSGALLIWSSIITCFVNGLYELRVQIILGTFGAIINIPLAYVFAQTTDSYIAIVIANIISYLPYCVVQTVWLNKYFGHQVLEQTTSLASQCTPSKGVKKTSQSQAPD